jgi:hypothetical protein
VVQERIPFPCKANGYHSLVPTVYVAMNLLQDKMYGLKKKASTHWQLKNRRRDTVVALWVVIIGVRPGLWELFMLLGRIRVGGLMMTGLIISILMLAVHGGLAKR